MMKSIWNHFFGNPADGAAPKPDLRGLPSTFAGLESNDSVRRPKLFDPSLQHFPQGYRQGEPTFADAEVALRWRRARRQALDRLVEVVARSPWADRLVLRGSLLLKAWYGDAARDPGDVDWIVLPSSATADEPRTHQMLGEVVRGLAEAPAAEGVSFDVEEIKIDPIWSYDRKPGRRLAAVWRAEGLPPGQVQADFVFGEPQLCFPLRTPVPRADGGETIVASVDPPLSLAWKLLWLLTDDYPRAKDLFDACLLAERTMLPRSLWERVRASEPESERPPADLLEAVAKLTVDDWDELQQEHPWIRGDAAAWKGLLWVALQTCVVENE